MDQKQNFFRLPTLAFVSWCFMLILMASAQLKIVSVVQLIAYRNFDLLVSCTTWDPVTLLIANSSTLSVRSHTVEISIFPLLDLSSMDILAPISHDPYRLTSSPLQDSPMMKYMSKVSNSSS